MKFCITMKDPDGVYDSLQEAATEHGVERSELEDIIKLWFQYSEYLTVEIDTDAGTCTVV